MANSILLEVVLEGKNIKVVQKQVDGVTDAVNKNTSAQTSNEKATQKSTQARNSFQRKEKGVAQATANGTKAFAKQAQGIDGVLVPAYAALAARIFALSAAFNALAGASRAEQLAKGLETLGTTSGIALGALSKDLQEATGNALSLEEAMRSTNLVISSGFSGDTIKRLGEVAKNASIALGRDTADSLARLTRGAAKLEPELLDELGIMVRLDEAAENYAREIGKTAGQLTNFEKRQAFMNAVLEEGERKFSALGDAVDASPFDKLSASLQDLAKTVITLVSTALTPLISLLTESTAVLSASVGLLATTFLRAMVPGVTELGTRYRELGADQSNLAESSSRILTSMKDMPPLFRKMSEEAGENALTGNQLDSMYDSLSKRIGYYKGQVRLATEGEGKNRVGLIKSQEVIKTSIAQRNLLAQAIRNQSAATLLLQEAQVAELLSIGLFSEGMQGTKKLFQDISEANKKLVDSLDGKLPKALAKLGGILGKAAVAGRLFLTVLVKFAVPIAIATAVLGALFLAVKKTFDYFNNKANPTAAEFSKKLEEMENRAEETKNTLIELGKAQRGLPAVFSSTTEELIAGGNAYDDQIKSLNQVISGLNRGEQGWFAYKSALTEATKVAFDFIKTDQVLSKQIEERYGRLDNVFFDIVKDGGNLIKLTKIFASYILPVADARKANRAYATSAKEAGEATRKFFSTLIGSTAYDDAASALDSLQKSISSLQDSQASEAAVSSEKFVKTIAENFKGSLQQVFGPELTNDLKQAIETGEGFEQVRDAIEASVPGTLAIFNNLRKSELVTKKQLANLSSEQQFLASRITSEDDIYNITQLKFQQELRQKEIAETRLALIQKQISQEQARTDIKKKDNIILLSLLEDEVEQQNILNRLKRDEKKITEEELTDARLQATLDNKKIQIQQTALELTNRASQETAKAIQLEEKRLRIAAELESAQSGKGFVVTAQQEAKIQEQMLIKRLEQAEKEEKATKDSVNLQYALLDVKLAILEKEAELYGVAINVEEIKNSLSQARITAEENATNTYLATLEEVVKTYLEAVYNSTVEGSQEALKNTAKAADLIVGAYKEAANLALSTLEAEKNERDATTRRLEAEAKLANLKDKRNKKAELTAKDILRIENETNKKDKDGISERVQAILYEATIKDNLIRMEAKLLESRLRIAKQESLIKLAELQASGVNLTELGLDPKTLVESYDTAIEQIGSNVVAKTTALAAQTGAEVAEENLRSALKTDEAQKKALEAATEGNTTSERITSFSAEGGFESLEGTREKIAAVQGLMAPMIEQLRSLGPEGELVAAVAQGSMAMADSFVAMSDNIKEAGSGMERGAAIANFAAQSFAQVGAIMQASSNARISGIDKEIEAEKKRDGKSKQSLERIRSLEKKKDAEKRKAFEANKKVMMATTVANTAAAMLTALAPPPAGLGPVFGPALAAVAGAMGAAQLAIIAGTSYDGGGSSLSGGGMASEISIGQRSQSVDLAKTQGGAGELAYLRGEQGTGSAENFKPAFMGAKYRAQGGPTTGYVVGEQGPELFVPEGPGRIVPNNEIQSATPINANINISAVDATGVEEVLVRQRGNIIGMIREAANSYGENFMEEVDTAVYTPSSAGARKY